MGGGKTRSSSANTQEDNKLVVDGFANTALGKGARLDKSDRSTNLGIGAKQLTGAAKDNSGNEGLIIGNGAEYNTGTKTNVNVGMNSTYTATSMDDNTANLLDTAMTMVYANSENAIERAAKGSDVKPGEFKVPRVGDARTEPAKTSNYWKTALAAVVLLGLIAIRKKKK